MIDVFSVPLRLIAYHALGQQGIWLRGYRLSNAFALKATSINCYRMNVSSAIPCVRVVHRQGRVYLARGFLEICLHVPALLDTNR